MAELVTKFTNAGVPLVSPTNTPTIRIRRLDTGVLVVTDDTMTELGDGFYRYNFVPSATLEYAARADGDPTAASQTTVSERYGWGTFSGITIERVEADIPAILADTDVTIPALIAALNDITVGDILAGVLTSGDSVDDALSRLLNIQDGTIDAEFLRKVFLNKAITTELVGGSKRIDFHDDDQSTIIDSITISADGLTRTNP